MTLHKPKVQLSPDLAEALIEPILECIEIEEDENDQVARSLAAIIYALASEADPTQRESFADDLLTAIYAKTSAFGESVQAFADFTGGKYLELVAA